MSEFHWSSILLSITNIDLINMINDKYLFSEKQKIIFKKHSCDLVHDTVLFYGDYQIITKMFT